MILDSRNGSLPVDMWTLIAVATLLHLEMTTVTTVKNDMETISPSRCALWESRKSVGTMLEMRLKVNDSKQDHSIENIWSYIYGNCKVSCLLRFTRYWQQICSWPWPWYWPIERVKVKWKCAKRKAMHSFIYDDNSNVSVCHQ